MTDDEGEDFDEPVTAADQAPHVSLGYPSPSGWQVGPWNPVGPVAGHAEVGEPADMRRRKAPVDADPIDLAGRDVPVVESVTE